MGALPPVFIEFLGKSTGFMATSRGVKAELAEVEAEGGGSMAALGAVGKGALMGIGVAAAAAAYESVKMAADFQSSMTQLNTLAHVSKAQVASLGEGVLDLAGQVGFSPDSLSEALYHIESSFASIGIKGPEAMNILKVAAEGAQVGNANLVDVTNALDAAIASGIPGVQNYQQAMGSLLSIVGSGDMEMQDLANALGTGVLAVVKGYGLSLSDVGAALATFGDNNIRGSQAATDLRMSVQALAVPAATAKDYLKQFGMTTKSLADDMQKGGLKLALNDLEAKMRASGITAKQQGAVITEMFGKKAGSGLAVLLGQLDRVNSKYPEIAKGAGGFASAWAAQSATFNQQLKNLEAGFQALAIKIGTALLPYATKFLGWLSTGMGLMTKNKAGVIVLASAIGGMLVIGLMAATVAAAEFTVALLSNPVTWIVIGVMALIAGLVLLVMHWKQVWTWIKTDIPFVANLFKSTWSGALSAFHAIWQGTMTAVQVVVKWFDANVLSWIEARIGDLTKWWSQNSTELTQFWELAWKNIQLIAQTVWSWIGTSLTVLEAIFKTVWDAIVNAAELAWTAISRAVTLGIHMVLNIVAVVLDMLTGHWSKAFGDMLHLVSQTFSDLWSLISGVGAGLWNLVYGIGKDIVNGIISGVESMAGSLASTVENTAKGALNSVKSALGINSPSRVFAEEVGQWIPAGIAVGVKANEHLAHSAVKSVADGMVTAANTALEINSPSKKFQQIGIWVHLGLVAGLTGTQSQVKSALNKTLTMLIETQNSAATHLEGYVSREGRLLETLANKRDAIATRLKAAQANLVSLQADWTKEQSSVASSIMSNASVVMSNSSGPMGAGDVVANMSEQLEQSQAFATDLNKLRAEGLNTTMIQQLASSGVSGGGQTAEALAGATSGQIAQLNQMQAQLVNSANSTGGAVADSMYGAGIASAQGLIKGLQSQEAAIQAQMLKIAEGMSTAIKRALGIHSPSRVFHEIGQNITDGLTNGVNDNARKPVGAMTSLSNALTSAARPKSVSLGSSAAGGYVMYSTNVTVQVAGSVRSDNDLRDVVQAEMLKLGARNSGTWEPYRRR